MNTVTGKTGSGSRSLSSMSPIQAARLTEKKRLARIRRIFELEQQVEAAIRKGVSAAAAKSELAGVRNGTVEVPISLGRSPRVQKDRAPAVTADRRAGPERRKFAAPGRSNRNVPSRKAMEGDLADLGKGKLTLSGIAVVKTLLETFSNQDISEILVIDPKVVDKVAGSHLLSLAPIFDGDAGMVLVAILEDRLKKYAPPE